MKLCNSGIYHFPQSFGVRLLSVCCEPNVGTAVGRLRKSKIAPNTPVYQTRKEFGCHGPGDFHWLGWLLNIWPSTWTVNSVSVTLATRLPKLSAVAGTQHARGKHQHRSPEDVLFLCQHNHEWVISESRTAQPFLR